MAINPRGEKTDIEGEDTREPTYGLPAKWISPQLRMEAVAVGYTLIEPDTVFLTHLQETTKRHAHCFISRAEVEKLLDVRKVEIGSILDDVVPNLLSYSDIQRIFQGLLMEQVSIKNIPIIFDVIADIARTVKDPDEIIEKCREKLKGSICDALCDADGKLYALTLHPGVEKKLINTFTSRDSNMGSLSPTDLDNLINKIAKESERLLKSNLSPIVLCAAPVRRSLRRLMKRSLPLIKVLSINEIDEKVNVVSSGVIDIDQGVERS